LSKKVFLGIGHGGKDPGAVAYGLQEKDINLSIGLACEAELKRHGVTVMISRSTDVYEALLDKINRCNLFAPDLAMDIHNNAGGGDGAEIFYQSTSSTAKLLSFNIEREVIAIGQNSRGIKTRLNSTGQDYFGFVRQVKAPSILIECAFLDSMDRIIVDELHEQKAMGKAIAKGVLSTLGIAWKPETPVEPAPPVEPETPPSGTLYRVQVGAFASLESAKRLADDLKSKGYPAFII